ncbi:vWA domain-containing protein [Robertmurraya massiliosenegalensis]|uniref:vWA domain-containing protein n=1 Tax=Robertmurraya massiliosenegalensis TaxID=1287657 RepID=UPI000313AE8F|nr:VWA domain-containing protein [Robertmurraya massiliosenegalensis]
MKAQRESVINTDSFDRRRFGQILDMSPRLQEIKHKGQEVLPTFGPLMNDVWASLYKMKPSLLEEDEYDKEFQTNHNFMSKVMADESFTTARSATRLDDLTSALGTVRFSEKVYDWVEKQRQENEELQKALEEAMKAQKELNKAQQQQQQAQEDIQDSLKNGDDNQQKQAQKKQEKANMKAEKAQQSLEQAMQQVQQQMQNSLNENGQQLSKAIKEATSETNKAKDDLVNLLAGGAGNGEGELQKIPLRNQISLAEMLSKNRKLREIAEWAGRFKAIARKKQKSKHVETIDRSGVTLGIDVERLLPSELAAYKNPVTKLDFLRRYAEHQTMMYAPEGKETLGKGPIILCLDQSSSMRGLDEQSKGFTLALMMIAKKQRRDFALIAFSSATKQENLYFEKGKILPADLVNLSKMFMGGGTNFLPPLKQAVSIIERKKRFNKSDIVFVTDGDPSDSYGLEPYCGEDGAFTKRKREKGFNVVTVLIGNDVSERYVKPFSDKIVRAGDFNNENVADTVFTI